MSSSRCLRAAFDACRPYRSIRTPIQQAFPSRRFYANSTDGTADTPKPVSTQSASTVSSAKPVSSVQPESSSTSTGLKQEGSKLEPESSLSSQQPAKQSVAESASTVPQTKRSSQEESTLQASASEQPVVEQEPARPITANVVAALSTPLKHEPQYGVPVASLQLRSYSVRSVEYFADFALRAAYYLGLAAKGPVPLPKKIERWTVLRDTFVHKKSQENFERITYKRNITIMDGDKSVVEVWLAVLRKWQFFGVGMKANVWEWEGIDVASKMDAQAKDLERDIEAKLASFGFNQDAAKSRSLGGALQEQGLKYAGVPMTEVREASQTAKSAI